MAPRSAKAKGKARAVSTRGSSGSRVSPTPVPAARPRTSARAGAGPSASAAAAPPAAAPAAPSAPLTLTQRRIRARLAVDTDNLTVKQIKELKKAIPVSVADDDLGPEDVPKGCCFDFVASSWVAHSMCERCTVLNQIAQVSADDTMINITQEEVMSTFFDTHCIIDSEVDPNPEPAQLPPEVSRMILAMTVQRAVSESDYVTLMMLMHLNCEARYLAAKRFSKLEVALAGQPPCQDALRIKADNLTYFRQAIRWFFADFAVRRKESPPDFSDYSGPLATVHGTRASNILCCIPYTVLEVKDADGIVVEEQQRPRDNGRNIRYDAGEYVQEQDICEVTMDSLNANLDDEAVWPPQKLNVQRPRSRGSSLRSEPWAWWARFANPYQRALWYEEGHTDSVPGAKVSLKYWLHDEEPDEDGTHAHVWNVAEATNKIYNFEVSSAL